MSACSIKSCGTKVFRHGLCSSHYYRKHRTGDPVGRRDKIRWFADELLASPTSECVIWPFGVGPDGYGSTVSIGGRSVLAHRYLLSLLTGEDPRDMLACHGPCNNRLCVNPHPQHGMKWGTRQHNVDDMKRDNTIPRGEQRAVSVYTEVQVRQIHQKYKDGISISDISAEFNCSKSNINAIAFGRSWKHLGLEVLDRRNPQVVSSGGAIEQMKRAITQTQPTPRVCTG